MKLYKASSPKSYSFRAQLHSENLARRRPAWLVGNMVSSRKDMKEWQKLTRGKRSVKIKVYKNLTDLSAQFSFVSWRLLGFARLSKKEREQKRRDLFLESSGFKVWAPRDGGRRGTW